MKTSFPEDKETLFAYLTISGFFDIYLLADALSFLRSILKAAGSKKVWAHAQPFSLLLYMQQLDKLSDAAFSIHSNYLHRHAAILKKPAAASCPSADQLRQCIGPMQGDNNWSCFPRSLTLAQFCDPYKAISRYCRYRSAPAWKEIFTDLQEYALAKTSVNEIYPPLNLLKLQELLSQLIEAAYLLHVRTNIPPKKQKQKN